MKKGYDLQYVFPNESFMREAIEKRFGSLGFKLSDPGHADLKCRRSRVHPSRKLSRPISSSTAFPEVRRRYALTSISPPGSAVHSSVGVRAAVEGLGGGRSSMAKGVIFAKAVREVYGSATRDSIFVQVICCEEE